MAVQRELAIDAVEKSFRDLLDLFRVQRGIGQLYVDRPQPPPGGRIPQHLADYYFRVGNRRVHDDDQAAVGPRRLEPHEVNRLPSLVNDDVAIARLHVHKLGQITLHPRDEPLALLVIRRARSIP